MSANAGRGVPFVIAAPSGTGKTTVCRALVERDPGLLLSVSHTTRPRRSGEVDGVDYHFVTTGGFLGLVQAGAFIEHADYNANSYGTSWEAIRGPVDRGLSVVLEIEVQGARQIRERLEDARFVFLLPPSMEVLGERLRGRGTDDEDTINRRLAIADREIAAAEIFDYAVVNDDLEETIEAVLDITRAERSGTSERVQKTYGRERVLRDWLGNAHSRGSS